MSPAIKHIRIETSYCPFEVYTLGDRLIRLSFGTDFLQEHEQYIARRFTEPVEKVPPDVLARSVQEQLEAYFNGELRDFSLPYILRGTPFQESVWRAMLTIPYGGRTTYQGLGQIIGKQAPRAIGNAVGSNPLPILIPCHRVVRADGKIGHYSGGEGSKTKSFLLDLEQNHTVYPQQA